MSEPYRVVVPDASRFLKSGLTTLKTTGFFSPSRKDCQITATLKNPTCSSPRTPRHHGFVKAAVFPYVMEFLSWISLLRTPRWQTTPVAHKRTNNAGKKNRSTQGTLQPPRHNPPSRSNPCRRNRFQPCQKQGESCLPFARTP